MEQMVYQELNRLRNRHVAKLLAHLGGDTVAPYIQAAIKTEFNYFTEDVENLFQQAQRENL